MKRNKIGFSLFIFGGILAIASIPADIPMLNTIGIVIVFISVLIVKD